MIRHPSGKSGHIGRLLSHCSLNQVHRRAGDVWPPGQDGDAIRPARGIPAPWWSFRSMRLTGVLGCLLTGMSIVPTTGTVMTTVQGQ